MITSGRLHAKKTAFLVFLQIYIFVMSEYDIFGLYSKISFQVCSKNCKNSSKNGNLLAKEVLFSIKKCGKRRICETASHKLREMGVLAYHNMYN
jgi:hypothetical protein